MTFCNWQSCKSHTFQCIIQLQPIFHRQNSCLYMNLLSLLKLRLLWWLLLLLLWFLHKNYMSFCNFWPCILYLRCSSQPTFRKKIFRLYMDLQWLLLEYYLHKDHMISYNCRSPYHFCCKDLVVPILRKQSSCLDMVLSLQVVS